MTGSVQLPAAASEFVGRERELRRLAELLADGGRLITLVGPGGIGKTRLAAEALRRLRHSAPERPVYWTNLVDREPGSDPDSADVLGAGAPADMRRPGPIDSSSGHWDPDQVPEGAVLVLDNCEHVLAGVGRLVIELLTVFPYLTIVATSREPIGWADEYIVRVPPLRPGEAVELFRRRAERTGRPVAADLDQMEAVRGICRRVDRNPLFIQLAAARLRHRPPAMVLAELTGDLDDRRLRWSAGISADADHRHRGVYDVIAWSYELCTPAERLLLERLSVFAAGYETDDPDVVSNGVELEAVLAVCADDRLPARAVPGLLERLAERSLVTTYLTDTSVRWYLVEGVRLFAFERLNSDPVEADRVGGRHRRYYRDKVVEAHDSLAGPDEQRWLESVRDSWDNILITLETSHADPDEALIGLETAAALLSMWVPFVNGGSRAVIRLTGALLHATRSEHPPCSQTHLRAAALLCWHFLWQGDGVAARDLLGRSVAELHPGHPDPSTWHRNPETDIGMAAALEWVWGLDLMLYELDPRALVVFQRAQRKFVADGDLFGAARSASLAALGAAVFAGRHPGDRARFLEVTRRSLEAAETSPSVVAQLWARMSHGLALSADGRAREGLPLVHEVLASERCAADPWLAAWAVGTYMTSLEHLVGRRLGPDLRDRAAELAWIIGAFRARNASLGIDVERVPTTALSVREARTTAAAVLGESAARALEQRGRAEGDDFGAVLRYVRGEPLALADAVERSPTGTPASNGGTAHWATLSRAEREVAVLAAAGWPNSAIARRRNSSVRTVDAQVASIRQKLTIASRREITRFVPNELAGQVEAARVAGWDH